MQVEFLLGPAGSGKTFRCLRDIRQQLQDCPEGHPLLLLAPKQTTYQLERQLLVDATLAGYTRLRVLSFDRLAHWILEQLHAPLPSMISEEGRVMVLRGLLATKRAQLKLFRASARLTGFAQELSLLLSELQRNQLTPEKLNQLAQRLPRPPGLSLKLQDLATLLRDYLEWLEAHQLKDADSLLDSVTRTLAQTAKPIHRGLAIAHLWVDGFTEWSPQELDLLAALLPDCSQATLTFCLDRVPVENGSWLSSWSVVRRAFFECRKRIEKLPHNLTTLVLPRSKEQSRFANSPVLQHLEQFWAEPQAFQSLHGPTSAPYEPSGPATGENPVQLEWLWPGQPSTASASSGRRRGKNPPVKQVLPLGPASSSPGSVALAAPVGDQPEKIVHENEADTGRHKTKLEPNPIESSLSMACCVDPEAELKFAAREILRHVRSGGRYREVTVLLRNLAGYHEHLQRIFSRLEIPFFVDRRQPVSHHPLAELTRSALRTVATQWKHEDWFAALKSGLLPVDDQHIDRLENEALARGWKGNVWHQPLRLKEQPRSPGQEAQQRELERSLESLRQRLLPPFERLALAMASCNHKPTGRELATAVRRLWETLAVENTLQQWAEMELATPELQTPASVHRTVWEQMNQWLETVELAFPNEPLSLREWLPILEAGLGSLTVGVVPPVLDQVLIGSVDRLRNADVKLVLLLGMNEGVFPAPPKVPSLLTETDRLELEKQELGWCAGVRHQLSRERYLAYIACTRARERLVLTSALRDSEGAPLHPSPFLAHVRRLFPSLTTAIIPRVPDWRESEHATELVGQLLKMGKPDVGPPGPDIELAPWQRLIRSPPISRLLEQVGHFQNPQSQEALLPHLAEQLYGPLLYTSVSRLEQFAACPFRFFVHSGLRAEERKLFELDAREQGSFQHDVLALFHNQLRQEGKLWRDLTRVQARERVGRIAAAVAASYREGLLHASNQSRFTAGVLTAALQDFVEVLVGWMHQQYCFDPVEVELPFGRQETWPPWEMDLGQGRRLALQGRIDRVDLCKLNGSDAAYCVVLDYKSSHKRLEPVLIANGLQLQLLAYLNVLRHSKKAPLTFGTQRLIPAGVFYVSLKGKYSRAANRREALDDVDQSRKLAYRHTGRFDTQALRQLDLRNDVQQGDQFNYRLTQSGQVNKNCREALASPQFEALLNSVEDNLKKMAARIFDGVVEIDPYRRGATTACDQCDYATICRIDPWTHPFRALKKPEDG